MSETPKISRKSGISADDGVERKKSIRNSTLRYARSLLPSSTPSGTPTTAAIRNASSVRSTVTPKSSSSAPPARPLNSAPSVAAGVGSRITLIQPARTTRSQTMNSTSGPTNGSKRPQRKVRGAGRATSPALQGVGAVVVAGSLIASRLEQHRLDQHALLEDALVREQVVELLEVGDVARLEFVVQHVRRERHLVGERALDGGVALHELARLVRPGPHELDAAGVGG